MFPGINSIAIPTDNSMFNTLDLGLGGSQGSIQTGLDKVMQEASSGGVNPMSLLHVQEQMQNYSIMVSLYTSIIKQSNDLDKNIIQNI